MIAKKILLTALLCSSVNLSFSLDDVVTGKELIQLSSVNAYLINGSRDNNVEHRNTCLQKYGWVIGNESLEINYKIAVKTGMQSATVQFLNSTVALQPMGLANFYSFLTQKGIPDELKSYDVRQIYFRLTRSDFALKKVAVSYENNNLDFQCVAEYIV